MRILFIAVLFTAVQVTAYSQQRIFIYRHDPAGNVMIKGFDSLAPFMDYYPSKNPSLNKTAVLICPGGGYQHLAWEKEGTKPAAFFNENGIDAFVLSYRLNNTKQEGHRYPDQYDDVTTAIRIIRMRAQDWNIDSYKIGVMGFSAGGHLASMAATMIQPGGTEVLYAEELFSTRPDFAILIYPVITMDTSFAHRGSRNMLLGNSPDEALINELSTEKRVTAATPPVFLALADDDKTVVPQNSISFYEALKKNKVPASMLIFDHGGHGFGMLPNDPVISQWPTLCIQWLQRLGFK